MADTIKPIGNASTGSLQKIKIKDTLQCLVCEAYTGLSKEDMDTCLQVCSEACCNTLINRMKSK